MTSKRPIISFVVFNKGDNNIDTITQSLLSMDKLLIAKTEFVVVVYNKEFSQENLQYAMRLRKFMTVRIIDYTDKHPESDIDYYIRGYIPFIKNGNDVLNEDEVKTVVEEYIKNRV